jgi:hypothetical protein
MNNKPIEVTVVRDDPAPFTAPVRTLEEEIALQERAIEAAAVSQFEDDPVAAFRLRQLQSLR